MKKLLRALFYGVTALTLINCASVPYGSYMDVPKHASHQMTHDAVAVLASQFFPAKTHIQFIRPVKDPFGTRLVRALRKKGFAVIESQDKAGRALGPSSTIQLAYLLDTTPKGLVRVSLYTHECVISKAYRVTGEQAISEGAWSMRRENHG